MTITDTDDLVLAFRGSSECPSIHDIVASVARAVSATDTRLDALEDSRRRIPRAIPERAHEIDALSRLLEVALPLLAELRACAVRQAAAEIVRRAAAGGVVA